VISYAGDSCPRQAKPAALVNSLYVTADCFAGICPYEKITCVIVDECHRAVGKNDAVSAISKMRADQCKFRVIGLSATPGSKREAIQV
jgi:ERCC4-related helicase